AVRRIVTMPRRQVPADNGPDRGVSRTRDSFGPPFLAQHTGAGLRDQVVFRRKVAVEAAMRQPSALHDVGDANSIEAMLAEERAGNVQDLLSVGCCLFPRHSHGLCSFLLPT